MASCLTLLKNVGISAATSEAIAYSQPYVQRRTQSGAVREREPLVPTPHVI